MGMPWPGSCPDGLLAGGAPSAAGAMRATCPGAHAPRDVPKSSCHICEVTRFENCALKFNRETTGPGVTRTDRLSREDTRAEKHMKKKMYGVVLNQNGTRAKLTVVENASLVDPASSLRACLKQDRCPCNHDAARVRSSTGARARKSCPLGGGEEPQGSSRPRTPHAMCRSSPSASKAAEGSGSRLHSLLSAGSRAGGFENCSQGLYLSREGLRTLAQVSHRGYSELRMGAV